MLNELGNLLKNEKKDPTIFDIVLYGSQVKVSVNSRDIDIVVIFKEGTLKERLSKVQNIKKKIKMHENIDIKGILWEELFKKEFFGRSGILLEGISVFDGKSLASKLSFEGSVLFAYNLRNKSHTQKVKFNYILSGRNDEGMVKKLGGEHISPGTIRIPIHTSLEFEDLLKMHTINYSKRRVLIEV